MFENIELDKNYQAIDINSISTFNYQEMLEMTTGKSIKVNIEMRRLGDLIEFEKLPFKDFTNLHFSIKFTKQIYVNLNISKIMNNSLIKSIDVDNTIITLNFYIITDITESILNNNLKVIERMVFITDDIQIHSKNYEILYQTNYILKEFKKTEDKYTSVKSKVKQLNDFLNSK